MKLSNYLSVMAVLTIMAAMPAKAQIIINEVLASNGSTNTDGVIFSHDDLTVNGSGSLTVTAGCGHGVAVNDELVITGGRLDVSAPRDAIRANDSLRICRAVITAQAGDDAIALKGAEGLLLIESGTFSLSAAEDGVGAARFGSTGAMWESKLRPSTSPAAI